MSWSEFQREHDQNMADAREKEATVRDLVGKAQSLADQLNAILQSLSNPPDESSNGHGT